MKKNYRVVEPLDDFLDKENERNMFIEELKKILIVGSDRLLALEPASFQDTQVPQHFIDDVKAFFESEVALKVNQEGSALVKKQAIKEVKMLVEPWCDADDIVQTFTIKLN